MASYYVWSGATGSANGSDWANAFTTLTTAFVTEAAGDTLYVAHDHLEASGTALTLSSSGTLPLPTKVICVDRTGSVPPVSADRRATAQITTTGNVNITFNGYTHYDGIIFVAGNSTGTPSIALPGANGIWVRFDNCSLRLGSTGAARLNFGNGATGSGGYVELNNTTLSFSATSQGIDLSCLLRWRNTPSALIGAAVPTLLFTARAGVGAAVECIGVDLSAAGSGKTIVSSTNSSTANPTPFNFIDCKLDAAVTKSGVPGAQGGTEIDFARSGATGVNYTIHRHRVAGLLNEETTIVRTGGASDGTTPLAWKIVTTANCAFSMPFDCPPIAIWNDTTGSSVTATVEGIAATLPTDQEVWVEVEYLGSGSSPLGSFVNDGKADLLATAVNQTSSSAAWGGSTTAFKLAVSFTPQQKGWIYARVRCAKASSTFYIEPLVMLT